MHLTARVDDALQAMVALAGSDAAPLPTNALAERLDLSYNYLLTIVAELRRAGFVKMRRGPGAGSSWLDPHTRSRSARLSVRSTVPLHSRTGASLGGLFAESHPECD